jgi:hypothetical protein
MWLTPFYRVVPNDEVQSVDCTLFMAPAKLPLFLIPMETGNVWELVHAKSGFKLQVLLEIKGEQLNKHTKEQVVSFGSLKKPYEKLKVTVNGQTSWGPTSVKFSSFLFDFLTPKEQEELHIHGEKKEEEFFYVYIKAIAFQKKDNINGKLGWYLGVITTNTTNVTLDSDEPKLIGNADRDPISSLFSIQKVSDQAVFQLDPVYTSMNTNSMSQSTSILTPSQIHSFLEKGYLQIRDVVPMRLINQALRRINHELGIPGRMVHGGVEGAAKLAGNVSNCSDILNLFFLSDAIQYAQSLMGGKNKLSEPKGAQIALRFPELGPPREPLGTEWHTDGMRQGKLHPFSLLVGITLSDVREPLAGNFTVFPGSHEVLCNRLKEDGTLEGHEKEKCFEAQNVWGNGTLPDLGRPVQLLASRGDIVLAHPALAHRGGLNFSPDIRYQVYFRLKHVHQHEEFFQEQLNHNLYAALEGTHEYQT